MTTISRPNASPLPGAGVLPRSAAPPRPATRPLSEEWGVVRRRVSRLTWASLALLAVAGVGLFQVLQSTRVTAVGYDVRTLETERRDLDADIRLLEAQIAASSNLEQLREEATVRLGMRPAQQRVRVAVDVPAPAIVPLPRRYVPAPEREAPPRTSWWEDLLGNVPGLH